MSHRLSRSLSRLTGPVLAKELKAAHTVYCDCGVIWLLRRGSASECPVCEIEHYYCDTKERALPTYLERIPTS